MITGVAHHERILRKAMKYWHMLKGELQKHWRLIQYSLGGLTLVLIGATLYNSWKSLSTFDWRLNYLWFAASLLVVSWDLLTLTIWWVATIRLLKGLFGWKQGARIWAYAQLTKYLPGGIWPYASRIVAAEKLGIPRRSSALSLLIETVLRVQSATIVFLVSLPFWPSSRWSAGQLALIAAALLVSLLLLNPMFLNKILSLGSSLLHHPPVDITSLKYRHLLGLLAGHILTVVGAGGAFYGMVASVHTIPIDAAFPLTGMLAAAVILGFLNPLTPQGLGTREGLLVLFLSSYLPVPAAMIIALLSRLWLMMAELLIAAMAALFLHERSR